MRDLVEVVKTAPAVTDPAARIRCTWLATAASGPSTAFAFVVVFAAFTVTSEKRPRLRSCRS